MKEGLTTCLSPSLVSLLRRCERTTRIVLYQVWCKVDACSSLNMETDRRID